VPKGHVRFVRPPKPRTTPAARPAFTCDDIEGHDWFARMPAAAQAEFRGRVQDVEARHEERGEFAKTSRTRFMVRGALLFFFTETFCASGPSILHTAAAVAVGLGVGALWHEWSAGRFRCALIAALPYVVLRAVFPGETWGWTAGAGVLGFVLLVPFAATIGFARELRRADDLDF
jgi:hypothetical protein